MKYKTAWIIALIALPLLAAVFTLHAQKQDDGRDKQERSFGVEKIYISDGILNYCLSPDAADSAVVLYSFDIRDGERKQYYLPMTIVPEIDTRNDGNKQIIKFPLAWCMNRKELLIVFHDLESDAMGRVIFCLFSTGRTRDFDFRSFTDYYEYQNDIMKYKGFYFGVGGRIYIHGMSSAPFVDHRLTNNSKIWYDFAGKNIIARFPSYSDLSDWMPLEKPAYYKWMSYAIEDGKIIVIQDDKLKDFIPLSSISVKGKKIYTDHGETINFPSDVDSIIWGVDKKLSTPSIILLSQTDKIKISKKDYPKLPKLILANEDSDYVMFIFDRKIDSSNVQGSLQEIKDMLEKSSLLQQYPPRPKKKEVKPTENVIHTATPSPEEMERREAEYLANHLKVLYESANIIVTITPPDINQFSEGNIKLLDKSNQNKILWEMTIPSQKLSGIGTGAIKSTAFFEDNKSGFFYAAIIRNELFPEIVVLKIDSKNETVSELRFASPFLPDLPFKKMKLNVVQNIVFLSVTYNDNKHQESAIDISSGFYNMILNERHRKYPYIPTELFLLLTSGDTNDNDDFLNIQDIKLKRLKSLYADLTILGLSFAEYLYRLDVKGSSINDSTFANLNKKYHVSSLINNKVYEDELDHYLDQNSEILWSIQKRIDKRIIRQAKFLNKDAFLKQIAQIHVSKDAGAAVNPSPEEMERRKAEYLANLPKDNIFTDDEFKALFPEVEYDKIADLYERGMAYDWDEKFSDAMKCFEQDSSLKSKFMLAMYYKTGRPDIPKDSVKANAIFNEIIGDVSNQSAPTPEMLCIAGRACMEFVSTEFYEIQEYQKKATEFFKESIEQGYAAAAFYPQYYIRNNGKFQPRELLEIANKNNCLDTEVLAAGMALFRNPVFMNYRNKQENLLTIKKGIQAHIPLAEYILGELFYLDAANPDLALKPNRELALFWMKRAANHGEAGAIELLRQNPTLRPFNR